MKCFHPFTVRVKGEPMRSSAGVIIGYSSRFQQVPCGHCSACLSARRQDWAFRIQVESSQYPDSSFFVSLTYDDDSLPYGSDHPTLCKSDLTEFFHKLRSFLAARDPEPPHLRPAGRKYFRYFACGEYGDSFSRPHYHFCFWDLYFKFDQDKWLKIFQQVWKFCQPQSVDIEEMSPARAEYVAKYCLKQLGVDYEAHGVQPPFAIMSRRPGIGQNFITDRNIRNLRSTGGLAVYDSTGCRFSLPRYYKSHFYSEDELRSISQEFADKESHFEYICYQRDHHFWMKRNSSLIQEERSVLLKLKEENFGKGDF